MNDLFRISQNGIYPSNKIINASEYHTELMFIKGPFDHLLIDDYEEGPDYFYPYVDDIDLDTNTPNQYLTIISCGGRLKDEESDNGITSLEMYTLAEFGGWNHDEYYCCQEVSHGGADILPDYCCNKLADCLLNFIGYDYNAIIVDDREIKRETIWRLIHILRSGPTLIPW